MTVRGKIADATTALLARLVRFPGPTFAKHVATGLNAQYSQASNYQVELLLPDKIAPDPGERELVSRIFEAFKRAKADYAVADEVFRPSSLWESCIKEAFEEFNLETLDGFHEFLTNFGCCRNFTGFEYGHLINRCAVDASMDTLLRKFAVPSMISRWQKDRNQIEDLSTMQFPMFGNMTGVTIDGLPIPLNAFFDDQCARMVTSCIESENSVVAELGGGYGGLAYCLLNSPSVSTYVGFDLPEVLACCSYYLMKSFPDRRFCLYQEEKSPFDEIDQYDAVLLPGFCLSGFESESFGVFVNRSSLSEMAPKTVSAFLDQIWKSSSYFWHLNHESRRNEFESGEVSLLNADYPVPPSRQLLARFPEQTNLPYLLEVDDYDHFWYLYGPKLRSIQAR